MFGIQTIATNHEELKTAQGSSNFNLFTSPKLHITEHFFFTTIYVEFKHCRKNHESHGGPQWMDGVSFQHGPNSVIPGS